MTTTTMTASAARVLHGTRLLDPDSDELNRKALKRIKDDVVAGVVLTPLVASLVFMVAVIGPFDSLRHPVVQATLLLAVFIGGTVITYFVWRWKTLRYTDAISVSLADNYFVDWDNASHQDIHDGLVHLKIAGWIEHPFEKTAHLTDDQLSPVTAERRAKARQEAEGLRATARALLDGTADISNKKDA